MLKRGSSKVLSPEEPATRKITSASSIAANSAAPTTSAITGPRRRPEDGATGAEAGAGAEYAGGGGDWAPRTCSVQPWPSHQRSADSAQGSGCQPGGW